MQVSDWEYTAKKLPLENDVVLLLNDEGIDIGYMDGCDAEAMWYSLINEEFTDLDYYPRWLEIVLPEMPHEILEVEGETDDRMAD